MNKLFLLYDDLMALCNAVIVTGASTSGEPVMVQVTVMLRDQRMMKTGWIGWLQRRRAWICLITWSANIPYDCLVLWALTCHVM